MRALLPLMFVVCNIRDESVLEIARILASLDCYLPMYCPNICLVGVDDDDNFCERKLCVSERVNERGRERERALSGLGICERKLDIGVGFMSRSSCWLSLQQ